MSDASDDSLRKIRDTAKRDAGEPAALPDASVFSFAPARAAAAAARTDAVAVTTDARAAQSHVFEALVKAETDVVGFVAYGLYKQNKREWFSAFEREHGRAPTEADIRSFIVGESLERRLATYRHLAEESLAELGMGLPRNRLPVPVADAASAAKGDTPAARLAFTRRAYATRGKRSGGRGSLVALMSYVALIAVGIAGMAWLLRSGLLPLGLGRW